MSRTSAAKILGLLLVAQCDGLHLDDVGYHGHNTAVALKDVPRKATAASTANAGSSLSASMDSYPGTTSGVEGVVSVTVSGGFLVVAYTLTGLNASETSGGLHIHDGYGTDVCSDSSLPGGHHYVSSDPWSTTWSKTTGSTTATGSFTVGTSGYDTLADNELHAVVVHDASGARVSCGFLQYYGALTSDIGKYPNSSGTVTGTVSVSVYTGVLEVSYTLKGLTKNETSGGLHIHSGSGTDVCGQDSLPGGHYYDTAYSDPWSTTWSKTNDSTTASGTFIVGASGYDTLAENYLHAVVVHAAGGSRIGCGYLKDYETEASELAATMGSYPGTSNNISGIVSVTVTDSGFLRLGYYVDGLAASETSGGLHIHAGTGSNVCSDSSSPEGHHFTGSDPWDTTWSKSAGSTVATGSFTVGASGYDTIAENVDHAVVLHDAGGSRIGCGYAAVGKSLSASMGNYPGSRSGMSGTVTVTVSMGLLELTYDLRGLPSNETSGGLHIHSGYGSDVCSDSSLPGGHHYASGYSDPWYTTWTKERGTTRASGSFAVFSSGYDTLGEVYLHAVVAHNSTAKIGCGVLKGSSGMPAWQIAVIVVGAVFGFVALAGLM